MSTRSLYTTHSDQHHRKIKMNAGIIGLNTQRAAVIFNSFSIPSLLIQINAKVIECTKIRGFDFYDGQIVNDGFGALISSGQNIGQSVTGFGMISV